MLVNRIHPALVDWMLLSGDTGAKMQTSDRPKVGGDNLTTPSGGVQPARGAFGDRWWNLGGSEYTRVFELHPALEYAAVGAATFAAAGLLGRLTGRPLHGRGGRWAGKPDLKSGPVQEPVFSPVV
jgi:hypothetical protein